MARPVVSDAAVELYESLGPWHRKAEERGAAADRWELLEASEASVGGLAVVHVVILDTEDGPGWSIVLDPDRAPSEWLPWDAQFGGVRVLPGLPEAEQRSRIKSTDGMRRGSPGAIVGAAQQFLTGTKTVYLVERHGSAYRLTVSTKASETPDLAVVARAVLAQKPGGLIMVVTTVLGGDYNSLRDTHPSYNDVLATFANYAEVLSDPTKQ